MTNVTSKKAIKMEMNRVSVAIISVLVTLAISFGGFCYQNGRNSAELENIKEQQLIIKKDLKEEIHRKADKDIVALIFQKINSMDEKLDKLIMGKEK